MTAPSDPVRTAQQDTVQAASRDPLAQFPDRRAGSAGERRALAALQEQLEAGGHDVLRQGFVTQTTRAGVVFGHLMLATLPAVMSWWTPGVAATLLGLLVLCMWGEWSNRPVLRRHLPRGRSYNLVVSLSEPAAQKLVLVAYVDQPESGTGLSRRLFAAGAATSTFLAATSLLRQFQVPLFDYAHLTAGALLLVLTATSFLLWRSVRGHGPSPGVGRLLELAQQAPTVEDTQVFLAFCGAGHPWGSGLRTLKRHHAHRWDEATRVVPIGERSLDEVLA
jgi:hypothetical protein